MNNPANRNGRICDRPATLPIGLDSIMPFPFAISDLRQRPEFFDTVADRIWQAWWRADGHPLDDIAGRLHENISATPHPVRAGRP